MVPDISWWALGGSCYCLVGSGWFLLFPGGLWMVPGISWLALDGSPARRLHNNEHTFLSHHRVAKALYQKTQLEIACPSGYCTGRRLMGRRLIYRWTGSTNISTTMNVPYPSQTQPRSKKNDDLKRKPDK